MHTDLTDAPSPAPTSAPLPAMPRCIYWGAVLGSYAQRGGQVWLLLLGQVPLQYGHFACPECGREQWYSSRKQQLERLLSDVAKLRTRR